MWSMVGCYKYNKLSGHALTTGVQQILVMIDIKNLYI